MMTVDDEPFPETAIVAGSRRDFWRLVHKFNPDISGTVYAPPSMHLFGVRFSRIIVSAALLADPPPDFAGWVKQCLMCRLAVDGEYIEEAADDAPEDKK